MLTIKISGNHGGQYALVDNCDGWLSSYSWHWTGGYISTAKRIGGRMSHVALHHAIAGQPLAGEVDHINRDKLDNRRCNLRIVTRSFNATNHNNLKGTGAYGLNVCKVKRNLLKPYIISCRKNGRLIYGGYFATIEDAQQAAKQLRRKLGHANP